jgi:hypothetical protein
MAKRIRIIYNLKNLIGKIQRDVVVNIIYAYWILSIIKRILK